MGYMDVCELWKRDLFFDEDTRRELEELKDPKEIEDRFYKNLEFGTGGLRGIMGAGTNRMNRYTVGRATLGYGRYLLHTFGEAACREKGVAIGCDTRNNSRYFAEQTAAVLSGLGILVKLHEHARPTPELSFSVPYLGCLGGIVLTASHNPKEYNGYKVYDQYGCQLVPWQAKEVISFVNQVTDYRTVNFQAREDLIQKIDVTDAFVKAVRRQARLKDSAVKAALKVVYTPLHGTGYVPVSKTLQEEGFSSLSWVEEQVEPDGDFPTVITPNPEDRRALALGIKKAETIGADLVLGTDPDCDRLGIAVRTAEGYQLMTGNQIGALLMAYILASTDLSAMKKPAVIKTVVTSELGARIALEKGLSVMSTLTGFKYVGEKITQFEQAKASGDESRNYDFLFGYEESYGYLAGIQSRDKDASVSALLICEMAALAKKEGKTLADRMEEIYQKYGYYRDAQDSYTLKGKDGLEKIASMMNRLRVGDSPFQGTREVIDYSKPVAAEPGFGFLPTSNVLKYVFEDGSWLAVRPSGTEPKIKIYYSMIGCDRNRADTRLEEVRKTITQALGL